MSLFAEINVEPTPQNDARRIKRHVQQMFQQIELGLSQIRSVVDRHGRSPMDAALGEDAVHMAKLYADLRSLVSHYKPDTRIAELAR